MNDALVIFDNGHGSNTPGKCSPDKKLLEYKWTREIV
jgi:N-acetylmuramoyl-L-alanine amidase